MITILLLNLVGGTKIMEDYVYDQMGKLAEATTGVAAAAEKALNAFGRKGQSGL